MRLYAGLAALLVLALAGCGGDAGERSGGGTDDPDVTFARKSLVQHAETLLLVDEAAQRGVSREVAATLEEVRAQRTAEVEALTDLLEGWDEPVPETARDHANSGHGEAAGHEDLADVQGAEFEAAWLDLMADHHEDALELAETQVAEGDDEAAVRLAEQLVGDLKDQVETLERLEDRVG